MTKNMKTTKHNKKEASEAKKEHPKKGNLHAKEIVSEFPLYVTVKTS